MSVLKNTVAVAMMAGTGLMGTAGFANATVADDTNTWTDSAHHEVGDNGLTQEGLIPIALPQNINVSPNLGCLLDQTFPDLTAQGLVGVVPVGANLSHVLEHTNLNLLANGNTTTDTYDYSCTSNQGSSQGGNNTHGSTGAGNSSTTHSDADGAGSSNAGAGAGGGGLLGATGVLGAGGMLG